MLTQTWRCESVRQPLTMDDTAMDDTAMDDTAMDEGRLR
jgi:hypothetical protein